MDDRNLRPLPRGWVWTRVGEAIKKIPLTGKKLNQSEYLSTGEIPVVDQGQKFVGGYTNKKELTVCCETPLIVFGDHTKVIKYINFAFVAGADGVIVFEPLQMYYPKLLYYFLYGLTLPEKGYARHFQFLDKSLIPLPPLPEQRRIVARIEELFTKLDAGIEALNKVKTQLKRYRQSVLKAAFEGSLTVAWREAHKGELEPASALLEKIKAERAKSGKYKETTPLDTAGLPELPEGWVWMRVGEITEINPRLVHELPSGQEISFLPMRCVAEMSGKLDLSIIKAYEEVRKGFTNFQDGDVIFAKITPCMENGKVAIVNKLKNGIGFGSTEFHVIRPRAQMPSSLFFFFLIQEDLRKDAKRHMTGTAGQLRVPATYLSDVLIPLPPLPEQHRIVEEIERHFSVADEIEKTVEQGLKQAERLRQSILKTAFEGNLVPQDPNDEPAEQLLERIKASRAGANGRLPVRHRT